MEHRFESHGQLFVIESQGFVSNDARADFETICARVEKALDGMPAAEVARLHAAAVETTDGPEAIALDDIGARIKVDVTKGWHNPNGAMVSLIALPAGA